MRIFPYIGLKHRPYIYMYICVYIRCLQFRLLKWPCRISRVNNRLTEFIDQFIPGGHHLVVISIYLSCLVLSCLPILVGGFNPSENYESQLRLLVRTYGKIKFMFQTTNQIPSGKLTLLLNMTI